MTRIALRRWAIVALTLLFALVGTAEASLITNAGDITNPVVIDLSQFNFPNTTFGPVQVGGLVGRDVVFTSTVANSNTGNGSVLGQSSYGLLGNGSWGHSGQTFAGFDSAEAQGMMVFTFNDGLLSAVGGFINYCPNCGGDAPVISAFGAGMVLLESYDLSDVAPISTPELEGGGEQENAGEFRGIARGSADIIAFGLTGAYIVLDDLRFGAAQAVPAPSPLVLLSVGLVVTAVAWRWRHRQNA